MALRWWLEGMLIVVLVITVVAVAVAVWAIKEGAE